MSEKPRHSGRSAWTYLAGDMEPGLCWGPHFVHLRSPTMREAITSIYVYV